jgi:hypothetical protein
LREGRISLFAAALARLGELEPNEVRAALDAPTPDLLQLACARVGIDRSVFPSILQMVRGLNGGHPGGARAASPGPVGIPFVARSAGLR